MNSMTRRDLIRTTAGAGVAMLALPTLSIAAEEPAKLYTLPKLPYAFDALEPHIDAKTMEIHHDRHHAGYVKNLNAALSGTEWAGKPIEGVLAGLDKLPMKIRTAVRNNGGGHFNHSLFWEVMSPKGGKASADLTKAIAAAFKDEANMLELLKKGAMTRFGSGWGWLIAKKDGTLAVVSSANQDNSIMSGAGTPILGLDVWEHAYYLKYQNKRADYVDAFFKVINWDNVSQRYATAMKG